MLRDGGHLGWLKEYESGRITFPKLGEGEAVEATTQVTTWQFSDAVDAKKKRLTWLIGTSLNYYALFLSHQSLPHPAQRRGTHDELDAAMMPLLYIR